MGELGDEDSGAGETGGDEMGGGLTLERGVHRQHHLGDRGRAGKPGDEAIDIERFRADAIEGGEHAAQHMVAALEKPAAFQRPEIGDIGNDADEGGIAPDVCADAAGLDRIEIAADGAGRKRRIDPLEGGDQRFQRRFAVLQQVQHDAAGRARAESGQARDKRSQLRKGLVHNRASAMRIAFMGTPDFAVVALDRLAAAGHEVAAVYTQPPRPANRGRVTPTPVQLRAEALGLPVRTPVSLKAEEERAAFAALGVEVAVVAAYGLLLPRPVLDAPRFGCINIHASLLPRWRGAAPVQRAILAGDAETGVTIMQMEAGLDTGPMLAAAHVPIARQTAGELTAELADAGAALLLEVLSRLPLEGVAQPAEGVTHAAKIRKEEARIDWALPAVAIDRLVRAMQPSPGAWFASGGQRVKLIAAEAVDGDGVAGTLAGESLVACGAGALRLLTVQPEGRARMAAADWLRGRRLALGEPL